MLRRSHWPILRDLVVVRGDHHYPVTSATSASHPSQPGVHLAHSKSWFGSWPRDNALEGYRRTLIGRVHRKTLVWQRHGDAGPIAREDLLAAEVAAIGNGFELVDVANRIERFFNRIKLCWPIATR